MGCDTLSVLVLPADADSDGGGGGTTTTCPKTTDTTNITTALSDLKLNPSSVGLPSATITTATTTTTTTTTTTATGCSTSYVLLVCSGGDDQSVTLRKLRLCVNHQVG